MMRESVIRDMTRLALESGAINLSQGYPDYDPPDFIVEAARAAIAGPDNQYTNPWGYPGLRERLAAQYRDWLGWAVDPMRHVTVTCGVTEALTATLLALVEPGEEVILMEPAHDNYWPSVYIADAVPVSVPLDGPAFRLDVDRVEAAVTAKTKAIVFNTPHNPSGRVFDEEEVAALADLVERHNLILITDEIYDRIVFDGLVHRCPGRLEQLRDRTITISGLGKTFAVTGWRLGYIISPERYADAVHRIHDFSTICAPTPLQAAACVALDQPAHYFSGLIAEYAERRAVLVDALRAVGFTVSPPEGAYYLLAGYRSLPVAQADLDPTGFARWLTTEVGVAVVPGDAAYTTPGYGTDVVRFAFCKKLETLRAAQDKLAAAFG
jgi:aminotransferase